MNKLAIKYYKSGYNCSQCILKAASIKFNFLLPKKYLDMCSAINNGFGIKSICSVLVASIMVLGLIFDEQTAKRLRIKFLSDFSAKHNNLNCAELQKQNNFECEKIIIDAADILERIILNENHDFNK